MSRPLEPLSMSLDSDSFQCNHLEQFPQCQCNCCLELHQAAVTTSDSTNVASPALSTLPCLLQSWRKRIDAFNDDEPKSYSHRRLHQRPALSSLSLSCELRHPRLERQQATCPFSTIWSNFPSSLEIYARPRHSQHFIRDATD